MERNKLDKLRDLAEQEIRDNPKANIQSYLKESQTLIHELNVYQIELELQNEQLLQTTVDLENARDQYQELYDFAPVGYAMLNNKGVIKQANLMLVKMLAVDRQQLHASLLSYFIIPEDNDLFRQHWKQLLAEKSIQSFDIRFRKPDSDVFYAHLEIICSDSKENPEQYFVVISDINLQKQTELKQKLAATAFENTSDAIIMTDAEAKIISVNSAFTTITGYSADEVMGKNPRLLNSGKHSSAFFHSMWKTLLSKGKWQGEIWNQRKSGEVYPAWLSIACIFDKSGIISHFVSTSTDITELKGSEQKLEFLAHHDPLTGLPNRLMLTIRLELSIQKAQRENYSIGIMFLDLDGFKHINDSLGHAMGDKVLIEVARRLNQCIRAEDTIARLGGDEFLVVMEKLHTNTDTAVLGKHILQVINQPIQIEDHVFPLGISIGICIYPEDGQDIHGLLQNADAAMYKAKEAGRNQYCYYEPELTINANQRIAMDNALHLALNEEQFVAYYQPQYSLLDDSLIGAEALIRWQHPTKGLILPGQFIPMAEQLGYIGQISEWMLFQACMQWIKWNEQGLLLERIAVNLSGQQINDKQLVSKVESILQQTGCPTERLELEVTEGFVMKDRESSRHSLDKLHDLGIKISIDDFGTGYSSLNQLKQLPIDKLKIDQSFISDLPGAVNDEAIVKAIVALGQTLQLTVIAEGVETESQRWFLNNIGCEQMQGNLRSRPLPAEEFFEFVKKV